MQVDLSTNFVVPEESEENGPSGALKEIDRSDLSKILGKAMGILDEREAHVILLYYHTDSTFGQIAETMSLTRQRVEQINLSALTKLQKFFLKKDPGLAKSICPGKIHAPKANPQHKKRGSKKLDEVWA